MLDVHPPHHPTHTWTDFFIHIATIVVGLLIAVGLEQGVEAIHHHHQLHQLEQSLDNELDQNLQKANQDIAMLDDLVAADEHNKTLIDAAIKSNSSAPLALAPTPLIDSRRSTVWSVPTDSAMQAARDNGTLSLLPSKKATFLARLEFTTVTITELTHQLFDAEYHVRALAQLHPDTAALTQEERHQLLVAISDREEIARHTRLVLQRMSEVVAHDR